MLVRATRFNGRAGVRHGAVSAVGGGVRRLAAASRGVRAPSRGEAATSPAPDAPPYRREFTEPGGGDFSVAVPARAIANDFSRMMRLATAGLGLTIGMGDGVRPYLDRGDVVAVLEEYCPPFAGYSLYYPARRQASPALRALLDYLLQLRQAR